MANEMDQVMAIMENFKSMLVGIESAQVLQKYIRAYDQYATEAMKVIMQNVNNRSASEIAQVAWAIADAMMVERRKREIGGVEQPLCLSCRGRHAKDKDCPWLTPEQIAELGKKPSDA